MAKKSFGEGLTSLLGGAPTASTQRREQRQVQSDPSEAQAPEVAEPTQKSKGRPRKTDGSKGAFFVVDAEQLMKVQQIAKDNGLQIKQVLGKALATFIEAYEAKHGKITITESRDIDELI